MQLMSNRNIQKIKVLLKKNRISSDDIELCFTVRNDIVRIFGLLIDSGHLRLVRVTSKKNRSLILEFCKLKEFDHRLLREKYKLYSCDNCAYFYKRSKYQYTKGQLVLHCLYNHENIQLKSAMGIVI